MVARGEESSEKMRDLQLEFEAKIKKQADIIIAFKEKVENLRVQLKVISGESEKINHCCVRFVVAVGLHFVMTEFMLIYVNLC